MMFRRPTVTIALCWLSLALASRRADADLVLTFEPDQTTYDVNDSVQVNVYLKDFNSNNPDDSALNGNLGQSAGGLSKFGFKGSFDTSVFSLAPGGFVVNSGAYLDGSLVPVPGNPNVFNVTGGDTKPGEIGAYGDPVLNSNNTLVGFSLKLGTLTFTALQPSAGSTITFSNSDFQPDFTVSGTSYTVASLAASPSLTLQVNQPVSAVPEPGSMSLVALAGAGSMWLAHRRRQRRGSAE